MCTPLICGTSNFPAEEYDIDELLSPCKAPKNPAKKTKDSKNPYANRGLDKFNALLAELEAKKQKIYTQKGSQDISFIRFVSTSSGEWKPIVVKAKGRIKQDEYEKSNAEKYVGKNGRNQMEDKMENADQVVSKSPEKKISKRSVWSFFKLENLRQPSSYLVVMLILILLFLTIFGRTFTVLCLSIGWYLLPLMKEKSSTWNSSSSSNGSKDIPKTMKEHKRRLSERNIVINGSASPNSVLDGPEDKLPVKHTHRKSW